MFLTLPLQHFLISDLILLIAQLFPLPECLLYSISKQERSTEHNFTSFYNTSWHLLLLLYFIFCSHCFWLFCRSLTVSLISLHCPWESNTDMNSWSEHDICPSAIYSNYLGFQTFADLKPCDPVNEDSLLNGHSWNVLQLHSSLTLSTSLCPQTPSAFSHKNAFIHNPNPYSVFTQVLSTLRVQMSQKHPVQTR